MEKLKGRSGTNILKSFLLLSRPRISSNLTAVSRQSVDAGSQGHRHCAPSWSGPLTKGTVGDQSFYSSICCSNRTVTIAIVRWCSSGKGWSSSCARIAWRYVSYGAVCAALRCNTLQTRSCPTLYPVHSSVKSLGTVTGHRQNSFSWIGAITMCRSSKCSKAPVWF